MQNFSENTPKSILKNYLNLINKQILHIKEEKKQICELLKIRFKKNKKKECNLLSFIANNIVEINEIRDKRKIFNSYFQDEILPRINKNLSSDIEQVSINNSNSNIETDGKYELYFSSCYINDKSYHLVNGISPSGIFSSRPDYLFLQKTKLKQLNCEPIEILFDNCNKNMHHSARRLKYCRWGLNINFPVKNGDMQIINIGDISLTVDENDFPRLYYSRLKKYFDPVIHSTLSAAQSTIVKFLRMISEAQEEVYYLPTIELNKTDNIDYFPRVILKNIIVSKRKWTIPTRFINIIKGSEPKFNEYLYLVKFFNEYYIPRFINILPNEKNGIYRPIDIYNPYSLLQIKKYKGNSHVTIEEMLPSPETINNENKPENRLSHYLYIS